MTWIHQHWLETLFVIAYLGILAHHAWNSRGTRFDAVKMPYWAIAVSFFATFVSTNSFIGHAGKSWDIGLIWYMKLVAYIIFISLAWFIVAPRFFEKKEQYGSRTVADFLGYHYNSVPVRRVAAAIIILASILYLVAVYKAASLGFQKFFGFDYTTSLLVIFVIVTAYTYTGGFGAVVKTDVWQGMFLAVGGIAVFVAVLINGGGISNIISDLRTQDPDLVSWKGKMPFIEITGLAIAGGIKMMVDPRQISRFYGLRNSKEIMKAGIIATLLIVITYICLLPVGAFARTLIPVGEIADSDEVMPYLLGQAEILGVFGSLLLLVLISAAMSTLDSVLLVVASVADQDLLINGERLTRRSVSDWKRKHRIAESLQRKVEELEGRRFRTLDQFKEALQDGITKTEFERYQSSFMEMINAPAVRRQRPWLIMISLASMLLAVNPFAGIVEVTAFAGSVYAACFVPTMIVGLFWRGTATAALTCMLTGAVSVTVWFFLKRFGWTGWHEIYIGMLVGLVSYVVVSLLPSRNRMKQHLTNV